MKLSDFTNILWATNAAVDARTPAPFSFEAIFQAAESKVLLELLSATDSLGFIQIVRDTDSDGSVDEALRHASAALEGRELRKSLVGCNAWCMVTAIVLEAIQQNFPMELRPIGHPGDDESPEA